MESVWGDQVGDPQTPDERVAKIGGYVRLVTDRSGLFEYGRMETLCEWDHFVPSEMSSERTGE